MDNRSKKYVYYHKFMSNFSLIISTFFVLMCFNEFYNVVILDMASQYPFGAEGPIADLDHYRTAETYVAYCLKWGIIFLSVLIVAVWARIKKQELVNVIVSILTLVLLVIAIS